jgi:hypothetical protein
MICGAGAGNGQLQPQHGQELHLLARHQAGGGAEPLKDLRSNKQNKQEDPCGPRWLCSLVSEAFLVQKYYLRS